MKAKSSMYFAFFITAQAFGQCNVNAERTAPNVNYECGNGTTWAACTPLVANADQVRDKTTGLIWKRCPQGMNYSTSAGCAGSATLHTWSQALGNATSATSWRLPSVIELKSILELGCYGPSINTTVFPATPFDSNYWTSTPDVASTSSPRGSWAVSFDTSYDVSFYNDNGYYVRLVKSGP